MKAFELYMKCLLLLLISLNQDCLICDIVIMFTAAHQVTNDDTDDVSSVGTSDSGYAGSMFDFKSKKSIHVHACIHNQYLLLLLS